MSKILIIEDQEDIRENIEEALELSDYQVITAKDGKAGIKRLMEEVPDLILCDIGMPELSGFEVLEYAKSNPSSTDTPFVFISAHAQKKEVEKGIKAGVDAYLTKPFSVQKLLETVEKILKDRNSPHN